MNIRRTIRKRLIGVGNNVTPLVINIPISRVSITVTPIIDVEKVISGILKPKFFGFSRRI
jgi:hypothetical protein